MPAFEAKTLSINGADLYVEVRGEGDPLLLLHGFTGSGADWTHVFELGDLARRYRLVIPDLRGHGRSNNPTPAFTHRQCALDVSALLTQLGIDRTRAIGMSLGGNTLLHLATREPARLTSIVLVSATMYYPAQARAIMSQSDEHNSSQVAWEAMRARHQLGDEQIRALWRQARGFANSYDDMTFTPPHLATITARVLIVYGDRDPLYPVEMAVEMARAIPNSALWVVPYGGHGPIFGDELRPQFVRAALAHLTQGS
jgi:pimeloyl-ACP methyl ester carboxylesterase